jgi:hypothetical protein
MLLATAVVIVNELMSNKKLKLHQTNLDHLISNLRGEVGEVIVTWTLWRSLRAQANGLRAPDLKADMSDRQLVVLDLLSGKLHDELVARLSELSERKIGQLTFRFAVSKIRVLEAEASHSERVVRQFGLDEKRNKDISHKMLPEGWDDHEYRHIPYRAVLHCLALAVRLMKGIDRHHLGPAAPYLWREARKKRYEPMAPPRVGYMILPYMRLLEAIRAQVIQEELLEGKKVVFSEMTTSVDGQEVRVLAAKEWGGILLGKRLVMLSEYPLQKIDSINSSDASG